MEEWVPIAWGMLPGPMRNELETYSVGFWRALPQIVAALAFLLLLWGIIALLQRYLPRVLRKARFRPALVSVFLMIVSVALWLGGGLVALTIAFPTVNAGNALTALGVGGVAVGFAFKDVFENFFAGILLLIREPFSVRDYVVCNEIDGQVEEITIRDTHIRQTDGQLVVAPNAMFFKNPVTVRTSRDLRRTTVICGVAYGEDVDQSRKVIEDAVKHVDSVRDDVKEVQVFAQEFANSAINFEVTWWTGSRPIDIRRSRDAVVAAVKRALDDAGIEIPFPYRTLTFKDDSPLPHRRLAEAREAAGTRDAAE